jgi:hypothetical protein
MRWGSRLPHEDRLNAAVSSEYKPLESSPLCSTLVKAALASANHCAKARAPDLIVQATHASMTNEDDSRPILERYHVADEIG